MKWNLNLLSKKQTLPGFLSVCAVAPTLCPPTGLTSWVHRASVCSSEDVKRRRVWLHCCFPAARSGLGGSSQSWVPVGGTWRNCEPGTGSGGCSFVPRGIKSKPSEDSTVMPTAQETHTFLDLLKNSSMRCTSGIQRWEFESLPQEIDKSKSYT